MQVKNLVTLSLKTSSDYEKNLEEFLQQLKNIEENSLVTAPEVCLTGFDYDNLDHAVASASYFTSQIQKHSQNKIVILTMLELIEGQVFNMAKVFANGELVYQRAKARLFKLGDEHKYMQEGSDDDFEIIEIAGVKLALLICFELRFKELWQKCEGADVIAIPAWWGKSRSEHFRALTQTLAIINQCYVCASDSAEYACSALSGIITPQGIESRNGNTPCLEQEYKKKEISIMRRYLDVGIK
ncbi:carbon-nitrogen hydrolase family protein [Sulfurimonas sp. C5]|uniref:carbon-nitrogen hydrolase family protein n=1 Tax=Sulfurimonas sp. C5 TaxID=3036947 RepID=UPI0024542BBC|nr:carbon-nitrogen hydrolase family protein [Sulfurimonas sp. C5]MDH4944868.1 carbon-nitrogen hydrolase family protein [Sulfurimonas sp. C5]